MKEYFYLDNSATTYKKPSNMAESLAEFLTVSGGNAGRGGHDLSLNASRAIFSARRNLKKIFNLSSEEYAVFMPSATYAINTLLKGILHRGDHIIVSNMEHNSVMRPIYSLAEKGIAYSIFDSGIAKNLSTDEIIRNIEKNIRKNTKMIFISSSSNIVSYSLPLYEIGRLSKKHNLLFGIDASQSVGHININLKDSNIDYICFPSHKGLFGVQGAGGILFSDGSKLPIPLVEGGSGIDSKNKRMPKDLPERLEAGTLPSLAIESLKIGTDYILNRGIENIRAKEKDLYSYAIESLKKIDKVKLYQTNQKGANILFTVDGFGNEEIADKLNLYGVCVRSGLHCSPLAHESLGTKNGGIRASFSDFTEYNDIDALTFALSEIIKK